LIFVGGMCRGHSRVGRTGERRFRTGGEGVSARTLRGGGARGGGGGCVGGLALGGSARKGGVYWGLLRRFLGWGGGAVGRGAAESIGGGVSGRCGVGPGGAGGDGRGGGAIFLRRWLHSCLGQMPEGTSARGANGGVGGGGAFGRAGRCNSMWGPEEVSSKARAGPRRRGPERLCVEQGIKQIWGASGQEARQGARVRRGFRGLPGGVLGPWVGLSLGRVCRRVGMWGRRGRERGA